MIPPDQHNVEQRRADRVHVPDIQGRTSDPNQFCPDGGHFVAP
jgi:hypothetical protein